MQTINQIEPSPIRSFEIHKLDHGYLVRPGPTDMLANSAVREYHAFETLEHALDFVREHYTKLEQAR